MIKESIRQFFGLSIVRTILIAFWSIIAGMLIGPIFLPVIFPSEVIKVITDGKVLTWTAFAVALIYATVQVQKARGFLLERKQNGFKGQHGQHRQQQHGGQHQNRG